MSRHVIDIKTKNKELMLHCGWDRPMQEFYATLFEVSEEEEIIYASLSDEHFFMQGKDFDYFEELFKNSFDISLPQRLVEKIGSDKVQNAGNTTHHHFVVCN